MDEHAKKICCVCGRVAIKHHKSILGQLIFNVCTRHYGLTLPAYGFCNKLGHLRMGLINKKSQVFIDLKYWEKESV